MDRRLAGFGAAVLLGLCASGCVLASAPVGREPATADPGWAGTWVHEASGAVEAIVGTVAVVEPEAGRLEVSWIDRSEGTRLRTAAVHLRSAGRSGDFLYASVELGDERFAFFLMEREGDRARAWAADYDAIRARVRHGRLPGQSLGEQELKLAALSADHLELLFDEERALFAWERPLLLRRIGD